MSDPFSGIQGLDVDAAVTNCGSREAFEDTVRVFFETLEGRTADIERYASKADLRNYTVSVHALKSAARLVGALKLSADALHLEEAGKASDIDEIRSGTPALVDACRGLKEALDPVLASDKKDLPKMSGDDASEMFESMRAMAAEFDLDGLDAIIKQADNYTLPDDYSERYGRIREAVLSADWGALEELL